MATQKSLSTLLDDPEATSGIKSLADQGYTHPWAVLDVENRKVEGFSGRAAARAVWAAQKNQRKPGPRATSAEASSVKTEAGKELANASPAWVGWVGGREQSNDR